jgi:aspartate dehydrogenase
MEIGIVGAGTMGAIIADAIDRDAGPVRLVGIADLDQEKARRLSERLMSRPPVLTLSELAERSSVLVECAGVGAVPDVIAAAESHDADLIVLSVGGLLDRTGPPGSDLSRIYCPSGAIAGLDAIRAAAVGRIDSSSITTRKPPAGLRDNPYLESQGIDLANLTAPRTVFEGSAREACRAFPANINVAAALSLAGIGPDRTTVRIIADPGVERNIHEVEVTGDFGRIRTTTENEPSDNPKTSRLAALSAIALIRGLTTRMRVGS